MNDEQIRLIIKSLKDKLEEEQHKYNVAIEAIQELCEHKELNEIMMGKKCTICGKIFPHDDKRLIKYKRIK